MNRALKQQQMALAAERYERRTRQRAQKIKTIKSGRWLNVDKADRVSRWLQRRGVSADEARRLIGAKNRAAQQTVLGDERFRILERQIGQNNQMSVSFLEAGMLVARTVGRVLVDLSFGNPAEYGTGFLVSPRLLLTNHHVLDSPVVARNSAVEFSFEQDVAGRMKRSVIFKLQPDDFFFNDQSLDYALVAVEAVNSAGAPLRNQRWNPFLAEQAKSITGQWVNIIQHPEGGPKQLVLRENQIVDAFPDYSPDFITYLADTEPGSSGSPVFNDRWEVVALHHAGVYKRNAAGKPLTRSGQIWSPGMSEDALDWEANEGVRLTKIIEHLRARDMTAPEKALFADTFTPPPAPDSNLEQSPVELSTNTSAAMNSNNNRSINLVLPAEPCEITVRFGAGGNGPANTTVPLTPPPPPAVAGPREESILAAAKTQLGTLPGVIGVRLGYKYVNDWITKQRAVVVTLKQRLSQSELTAAGRDPLPAEFQGLPVEKENAGITDLLAGRLRASSGLGASESLRAGLTDLALESRYTKPPGLKLPRLENEAMEVIAHAGPDASWPVLQAFLQATKKTLTIAMYDFTAPHILAELIKVGKKSTFKKLRLCIQAGESLGGGVKADDLPDAEVVKRLKNALGGKFEVAWITVDSGGVDGWVAHDYHIKVAVRDSSAFWLSSGNWQSTNQPDGSPFTEKPPVAKWLSNHNREWHVVVSHPALAKVYEDYIDYDFRNNSAPTPHEALGSAQPLPDIFVPDDFLGLETAEAAKKIQYFAPKTFTGKTTVQAILTPDNYLDHVIPLINGAKKELLIENQSFAATTKGDIARLMTAVLERQRHGVKTRIIFRSIGDVRKTLDGIQAFGFDMNFVRVQASCHTKGIIVDGKKVLLGSQNLTGLGVTRNRDASLLFEDERLAGYFHDLFEYDWQNRARASAPQSHFAPEIAHAGGSAPEGFVRLAPKDYLPWI